MAGDAFACHFLRGLMCASVFFSFSPLWLRFGIGGMVF